MRLFIALLTIMMISSASFACSCIGPSTFCQTLQKASNGQTAFNIVVGRRGALQQEYIDFHIEKSLFGSPLPNKIKIEFGYGADCRVGTQYWDPNLEYILILAKPQSGDIYSLSICSYSVLVLANGIVSGLIDQSIEQSMSYLDFLKSLDCFDGKLNYVNISVHQSYDGQLVFTNLTNLQTNVFTDLVDVSGRTILSRQMELEENEMQFINLPYDIPSGIYMIVFTQDGLRRSQKIFL